MRGPEAGRGGRPADICWAATARGMAYTVTVATGGRGVSPVG